MNKPLRDAFAVAGLMLVASGAFYAGSRGAQAGALEEGYAKAHNDLSALLVVYDSIAKIPDEPSIRLVRAMISAEFLKLVKLHASGQPETSAYIRCAVTRKKKT